MLGVCVHPAQHGFNYPAVYRAHAIELFGGLDKVGRRQVLTVLIDHSKQNFIVGVGGAGIGNRGDFLAAYLQTVFIQCAGDAGDPGNDFIAFAKTGIAGFDDLDVTVTGFLAHLGDGFD